jgi:restriction system protein
MLDGESAKRVRNMMNAIFELANTQPDSIDWANPDHWINERLSGDVQRLARKIWEGSGKALNPRYLYGHHKIIRAPRTITSSWDDRERAQISEHIHS